MRSIAKGSRSPNLDRDIPIRKRYSTLQLEYLMYDSIISYRLTPAGYKKERGGHKPLIVFTGKEDAKVHKKDH